MAANTSKKTHMPMCVKDSLNPSVLPLEHFKMRWAQMRKVAAQKIDKPLTLLTK